MQRKTSTSTNISNLLKPSDYLSQENMHQSSGRGEDRIKVQYDGTCNDPRTRRGGKEPATLSTGKLTQKELETCQQSLDQVPLRPSLKPSKCAFRDPSFAETNDEKQLHSASSVSLPRSTSGSRLRDKHRKFLPAFDFERPTGLDTQEVWNKHTSEEQVRLYRKFSKENVDKDGSSSSSASSVDFGEVQARPHDDISRPTGSASSGLKHALTFPTSRGVDHATRPAQVHSTTVPGHTTSFKSPGPSAQRDGCPEQKDHAGSNKVHNGWKYQPQLGDQLNLSVPIRRKTRDHESSSAAVVSFLQSSH